MMRWSGILLTVAVLLALLAQALVLPQSSVSFAQEDEQTPAYVPGQLIIGFRPGVTKEQIADFYATYGLAEREDLSVDAEETAPKQKLASIQVDVTADLVQLLESDPRVRYAEPNYLLHIARTPDDPDFDKLWGLRNVGQTGGTNGADVSAMEAWDISTGSKDIIIAIIDTGIDFNHEDLAANMWVNTKECPQGFGKCSANGQDEDGNGYVDDFYGANTITDNGNIMDDFGHGTHVAGTIGGVGNNGTGVVGVNWNIRMLGCKFLSASGSGTTANAIKCFNYISELKNKQGYNIVLTNNSWGGGLFNEALLEAMSGADAPLHICAAGNSNSSLVHYPAGYELDNIISVAATDHEDIYASFSNWGADWVDMAAPGVDTFSTVPTGSCAMCDSSGYRSASGTSMATPHVSGAAALLWSKYPTLTNDQIKGRLLSGIDSLTDRTKQTLTNGRLNLLNALEDDQTPPATVTNLAASGVLMTQVHLSWTATGDDGLQGTANAYDIRYATAPISDASWKDATQVEDEPAPQPAGSIERFTVTGLEPATTYYFAMKVVDNVGNESDLSNIVVVATSAGTIVFEDDMENGAGNWTAEGEEKLWHLSQLRANSPSNAWYYGQESTRNYDTGEANRGYLTSPAITLVDADEVLLTFYEWSQLQTNEDFDRTRVQVSTDGEVWETVFESHGTEDSWVKRTVSLSPFIERSGVVHVRFWFDTINDRFNNFEGWYIDDVQVLVAKLSRPGEEQPMANLVVRSENIGFDPLHPVEGDKVNIHAVVLNSGRDEANDVMVYVADLTDGTPVPVGQPQTIGTIPAGGSGAIDVLYDTAGRTGERTIQVVVDPGNFVPEVSNTDNSAEAMLLIAPPSAPNLAIEAANIGFDPVSANPGDQVTVYATIRNDGDADATDVQVQFVDATGTGTIPIGEPQVIDVIPAGGSATLQVTYDTGGLSGDRDIGVVVDPNNMIGEPKESDNSAEKRLSLIPPSAPNLVMLKTNIGFDPIAPTEGETVTLRATVLNDGNTEARDVLVQFVDGTNNAATPIGEQQTIATIPAGGSGIAEVSYETSDKNGDRKIKVVVDPHNFVAEAKETDNTSEETLKVALPPMPNLAVQAGNIGFSPADPVEGEAIAIYATIVNNGDAAASETVVQFVDVTAPAGGPPSAMPLGDKQTIDSIPAGGSSTVQISYTTASRIGERTIQVVVDPGNFVSETDETDNTARKSVRVQSPPLANLAILPANIQFTPSEPTDRERVSLHAIVLNNGAAEARNVLVQFLDMSSGVAIPIGGEQFIERIPAGGSGQVEATLTLNGEVKDRKIQVQVDSNNLIVESNERDNTATKTLPVMASPLPNLVVMAETVGYAPRRPKQGDVITLTTVVLNNGATDAERVVVQFADITNGRAMPIGAQQVIELIPAGSSGVAQVIFDSSLLPATPASSSGERRIRVEVDPNNFIRELDEIDNKDTATLVIEPPPAPNLVVQASNIGFAPPTPRNGDAVSVTVTILNAGLIDAGQVLVQFVDVTEGNMIPVGEKQTIDVIPAGSSATTQVTYDTADKEGARKIQVLVDPHTMIPESSESDNSAIQTLNVMAAPAPNLVVQLANIGVNPINPREGDTVTLRATVLNNGEIDARDVVVQFVDVTAKSPAPIAANQTIPLIPAGGSGIAEVTYDTTGKITGSQSSRKIQIIADYNNLIVESNENDNSATQTVTIVPLPAPNLMLQVSNIGFDPLQPNPGDQVTVYATIMNKGTIDATNVMVQLVDATNSSATSPIGQPQVIEAIPAGGSGVVQIVYDTTGKSGDRKIQVVVDPNNFIRETSETDNTATKTLSLVAASAPNLVMSSNNLIFTPSAPHEGAPTILRALVINDGNALANSVVVQFLDVTDSANTITIGQPQVIDSIGVGGSGMAQVSYSTAGKVGDRKIKVVVDPNNFIAESKETDNQVSSKTLTVEPATGINLAMHAGNIGFNPAQPVEGDRVTLHAVVINNGVRDANDVTVQFVDVTAGGNTPIGVPQIIDSIPAGSSGTAQVLLATDGRNGERRIQVVVDPNNFIPETDEADNAAAAVLTVSAPPAPNLMVLAGNVKFTPPDPAQGNPVTITVTILNGGTAAATDVVVQLLDVTGGGARPIGPEQIIDELPAGGNTTINLIYENTDQPGDRQIQVTADPNDAIAETDEGDNRAVKTLTISPPKIPNLVVRADGIVFEDASPVTGDQVGITVTVRNDGNVEASNVVVQIADATDGGVELIGDPQTIPTLAAGGSATVVVEYDTTDKVGDRRIRVSVDPDNTIFETDETDNEATKLLRVAAEDETPPDLPNLVVLSGNVRFEPASPTAGDLVTITVTVLNEGTQPAEDVLVRLVDTTDGASDPIGEATITGTIAVGESGVMSVTFDTTDKSGTRQIQVTADPDNTIEETDEEDNQVVKPLTISAAATAVAEAQSREVAGSVNLTVQIEGLAVKSLGENDSLLTITATVQNSSDRTVDGVLVQFMDTDAGATGLGGLQRLPQVLPNGSAAAQFSFVLPGPADVTTLRTIEVTVDPYDAIAEVDEMDNVASQAVDVAALRAEPMEVSVMP